MLDDFTNLGILKLRLWQKASGSIPNVLTRCDAYMQKRYYFALSDHIPVQPIRPPQELLLRRGLIVEVNQRPDSPWLVRLLESGIYVLEYRVLVLRLFGFRLDRATMGSVCQRISPLRLCCLSTAPIF